MPRIPFLSDALLGPQSRREFLKRVTGAAASAALPKLPEAPVPAAEAQAISDGVRRVPPGLIRGFTLPGGAQLGRINGQGPVRMVAWPEAPPELMSFADLDELNRQASLAEAAIPSIKHFEIPDEENLGPTHLWNYLTKQWHPVVETMPAPNRYETIYLQPDSAAPRGARHLFDEYQAGDPDEWEFDVDIGDVPPTWESARHSLNFDMEAVHRSILEDSHASSQKEHREIMRSNPEYARAHIDRLRGLGYAPGTRFNPLEGLSPSREVELPSEQPRQPYMSKVRKAAAAAPFLAVPLLAPREDE